MSGRRACGFTLIELLVVISIIALLIALLLPALGQARHAAMVAQCGSNLHQVALGVHSYLPDHQGRFPTYSAENRPVKSASWFWNNRAYLWGTKRTYQSTGLVEGGTRLLTDYMGEFIARCPLDQGYGPGTGLGINGPFFDNYGTSYVYQSAILSTNGDLAGTGHTASAVLWGARLEDVAWPSLLVMAGDFTLQYPELFTGNAAPHYAMMHMHDPREQRASLLFTDGHLGAHTLRDPPEHVRNDEYHLVRPDYVPGRTPGRGGGRG